MLKDLQEVIDESERGFTCRFKICDECNKAFDVLRMTNGETLIGYMCLNVDIRCIVSAVK